MCVPRLLLGSIMEEVFEYNNNANYDVNFRIWYSMNCRERRNYGEELLNEKEAKTTFDKMYSLSHTIKINKEGILEDVLVRDE